MRGVQRWEGQLPPRRAHAGSQVGGQICVQRPASGQSGSSGSVVVIAAKQSSFRQRRRRERRGQLHPGESSPCTRTPLFTRFLQSHNNSTVTWPKPAMFWGRSPPRLGSHVGTTVLPLDTALPHACRDCGRGISMPGGEGAAFQHSVSDR